MLMVGPFAGFADASLIRLAHWWDYLTNDQREKPRHGEVRSTIGARAIGAFPAGDAWQPARGRRSVGGDALGAVAPDCGTGNEPRRGAGAQGRAQTRSHRRRRTAARERRR